MLYFLLYPVRLRFSANELRQRKYIDFNELILDIPKEFDQRKGKEVWKPMLPEGPPPSPPAPLQLR